MLIHNLVATGSAIVSGSSTITGNLTVLGSISGSINSAISASYALNATSASYALNATSASYSNNSTNTLSASYAQTSSFADTFTVAGTLTAQKLVVQTITSSIVYSSGSNVFGNSVSNTQSMTGSLQVTGSTHYLLGNVGIGTSSPSALLNTFSATTATQIIVTGADTTNQRLEVTDGTVTNRFGIFGRTNGDAGVLGTQTNHPLVFNTNATERMRITSGSNVLIGTTTDAGSVFKLQVKTTGGSNYLRLQTDVSAFDCASQYTDGTDSVYAGMMKGTTGLSGAYTIYTGGASRLTITSAGNVGIGTTSPDSYSDPANNLVVGTTSGNNGITISAATTGISSIYFADGTTGNEAYRGYLEYGHTNDYLAFGTAASERMRITSGGEVYIAGTTDQGAYNLQVNGTGVWGAGAYVNGSDFRLKNSITPLNNSLDLINKMKPVTYKFNEEYSKDQSTQTGFIAQDLQEILKNEAYLDGIVKEGSEYLSVAYQNIIPLLVKAVQELSAEIKDLKTK